MYILNNTIQYKVSIVFSYVVIMLSVAIFHQANTEEEFMLLAAFSGYITLITIVYLVGVRDLLSPISIWLMFLLIYEILKFPFYLSLGTPQELVSSTFLVSNKYQQYDYISANMNYLAYSSMSILILITAFSLYKPKVTPIRELKPINFKYYKFIYKVSVVVSTLSFLFLIGDKDIFFILAKRAGLVEAQELMHGNYVLVLISSIPLFFFPVFTQINLFKNKFMYVFLFIYISLISYLMTGSRGLIVYSIVTIALISIYRHSLKLKFILIPFFLYLIFTTLGTLRNMDLSLDSSVNHIQAEIKSRNKTNEWNGMTQYQLQLRDEMIFENMNKIDYGLGESYLSIFTNVVPRSILGDLKPDMIDGLIAKEIWGLDNVGLPLNATTESYYNFGYFGLSIFVLFGILMKYLYKKVVNLSSVVVTSLYLTFITHISTLGSVRITYMLHYAIVLVVVVYVGCHTWKAIKK